MRSPSSPRSSILPAPDTSPGGAPSDARPSEAAQAIISALGLIPHAEGGHYVETWRHHGLNGERGAGTAIYYLLCSGEVSGWHRIDAAELWHFYAGSPTDLTIASEGAEPESHRLGPDLATGERPQVIVPAGAWQTARSLGEWTLVGCTVSPAFEFEALETARSGWQPGAGAWKP